MGAANTDPVDVVAGVLNTEIVGHSGDYNGGRLTYSRSRDLAIQGLSALREAGFELVKLHDRPMVNSADNAVWCQAPYVEQEFGGDVIISDRLGIDRGELRDVAVALLSAERVAYDD